MPLLEPPPPAARPAQLATLKHQPPLWKAGVDCGGSVYVAGQRGKMRDDARWDSPTRFVQSIETRLSQPVSS